ncbi:MAG: cation diffusion facilitator family transporter [Candidatus Bathyarchaeia archaeon]
MQVSEENAYKIRSLKLSTFAIGSVVLVEVSIGLLVNSLAVLSDGMHAMLDTVTSILLFYATRAALKPPDEDHLYGHEKFETIGGLTGGLVVIGIAILVVYEAAVRLTQGGSIALGLEQAGFFAIGFTFTMDFTRIVIFRKAGSAQSATVKVGFYHAIADLSSTVIALLGFALAAVARVFWADSIASIALGILLTYMSLNLVRSSVMELSDAASRDIVQRIRREILTQEGVLQAQNLRTRKAGSKMFVEVTVQVSNSMNLEEAHALASRIEKRLAEVFGMVDTTIHIEPLERQGGMEQLVEQLARVEGVQEVHEISTVYAGGKLYITLHALVNPQLSVDDAHSVAEKIETRLYTSIKQLEDVTVHVEPYGEKAPDGETCDEELKRFIQGIAEKATHNIRVRRVLTYNAGGKRYISIKCAFAKQVSIAEAHAMASDLEKEIGEKCTDAVVTVHVEPDTA